MDTITKAEERLVRLDTIQRIIDTAEKEKEQFKTIDEWIELLKALKNLI